MASTSSMPGISQGMTKREPSSSEIIFIDMSVP